MKNWTEYDPAGLIRLFSEAEKKAGSGQGILFDIYYSLVESASDSIYLVDRDCRYLFMNRAHLDRLGLSIEKVIGRAYGEFHTKRQQTAFKEKIDEVIARGRPVKQEHRSHRDNRYFLRTFNPLKNPTDEKTAAVAIISKDITECKQAEEALRESEEKYRRMLNSIEDGYYEMDLRGNFTFINPSMSRIIGHAREELIGMNNRRYMDEENARRVFQAFHAVYRTGMPTRSFDWEVTRKDGTKASVWCSVSLKKDPSGNPVGFYGTLHDITDRKKMEEEIRALAIIDPLTGLYNRRGFMTLAELQLKNAQRSKKGLFLVFADLDNLKKINDTLGHKKGDETLAQLADILKETFRTADVIARIGGDEFAVLAVDSVMADARVIKKRLQSRIDAHNAGAGRKKGAISLSIGIARYDPENPESMDSLMSRADEKMYAHKRNKMPS